MTEEEAKVRADKAVERLETIQRYARVSDRIDAYKVQKGILPNLLIHGGEYATLFLHPEYESKWKGTFYDKERMFLSTTLKDMHSLSKYHYFAELGKRRPYTFWILGYCDSASGCDEGIKIHLVDPYGEVLLEPFAMPADMIMCYVGKMLIVKIDFTPNGAIPREVGTLPFTLTERITEGHPLFETLTED